MTHPTDALRLVVVPRDPTVRMVEAAFETGHLLARDDAKAVWHSMRAAAPATPLPEGGGQCSGITGELSGWRDISTAPKDGTKILVWTHHGEVEISEWYQTKGDTYVPEPGTDLFRAVKGKVFFEGWNSNTPTHWMPFPAALTGAK